MTFSVMSRSASAPSLQAALLQAPEREASWITSPPMLPVPHAHSASSAQAARGSLSMGLLGGFPLSPRMGSCGAATSPSCHASCSDPSPRFSLRHSVTGPQFFGASVPDSRPAGAMGAGMRRVYSDNTLLVPRSTSTSTGDSTPRMCRVTSSHDLQGSSGVGWDDSKDASSAQGDAPLLLPSTLLSASLQGFASNGAPLGTPSTRGMAAREDSQDASGAGADAAPASSRFGDSLNGMNSMKSIITGLGKGTIRRGGSVPSAGSAPWKFLQGIGEGDGEEEEEEEEGEGMEDALIVGITESVREGPVLWLDDWRKGSLRALTSQEELTYSDTSQEAFCDRSYDGPSRGLPLRTPLQEARGDADSTEATEEYYVRALQADPDNGLILRNFSRFLVQTKGDYITAERCLEKAVVACPRDADVLVQYAKLLWDFRHDAEGATTFFERAVQSAPDDCYVLAAYASFLWSVDATSNAAAAAEAVASKPGRPATLLTPATT